MIQTASDVWFLLHKDNKGNDASYENFNAIILNTTNITNLKLNILTTEFT